MNCNTFKPRIGPPTSDTNPYLIAAGTSRRAAAANMKKGARRMPASSSSAARGPVSISIPHATRLLSAFADFLTVCIHNILFYRQLYPQSTFLTSRAYNLPVHQSRHPVVCSWIRDAVDAARVQIAKGTVERLAVVVYDGGGAVMERWMFDLGLFPVWKGVPIDDLGKGKPWDYEADDRNDRGKDPDENHKVNWANVHEQLRAGIRQLAFTGESLAPLPNDCTFTLAVELRDEAEAPIGHPQPWVPTQPNLQTASRDNPTPGDDVGGARTTAVRTVEAGPLFFECWVEEGKAKLELPPTMSSDGSS